MKIQKWSAASLRGDRAELDFLSDTDPLWDDVAAWSETCLGTGCEDYESCFLTRMRQEAAAADLVIVNHHLLLADAALREGSLFQVIPSYATLILDEAHLLEDVATDFFGTEISNLRIERLVRDAERERRGSAAGDASIPTHLMRLAEASARFFRSMDFAEGARRLREAALEGLSGAAGRDLVQHLILLHDLIHALPESRRRSWDAPGEPGSRPTSSMISCVRGPTPPTPQTNARWCAGRSAGVARWSCAPRPSTCRRISGGPSWSPPRRSS